MKIFIEKINLFDARLFQLSKLLNRISLLRLGIFIVLGILLVYLVKFELLTSILLVFPLLSVISFGAAIKYYNKIAFRKKHTAFLKSINESELLRYECKLEGFDSGDEFGNQDHPYSSDLDVFGQHSIFQLVNRTTTESGTTCLAKWLSEPAAETEILLRQEVIKELAQKLEWRQDFQASGMHFENKKSDYTNLLKWTNAPVALLKNRHLYTVLSIMLSVLSLLSFYYSFANVYSPNRYYFFTSLFVVLFVNYVILRKFNPLAEDIVESSQRHIDTLKAYRALIKKIEGESFNAEKLSRLQSELMHNKYSAYHEINKLCKLLDFSQQRGINRIKIPIKGNFFYSLLNSFLLLDIYLIIGVEKWKSKNKSQIKFWAEAVSEFEALNSFAGFSYSNPDYAFPEISANKMHVHFEALGHPLINSEKRVCNNFRMKAVDDIVLITGSNMGGKSTFLRAVGVNLVLALAGAPCCAQTSSVSIIKLFTSMRTQDNLQKGISSFYAELNRIEEMLKLIESTQDVFFLLDEMFKGTNSEDRHKGGFSLIRQISELGTAGIVATHDIELAKLSAQASLVTNYSFNSEIKNDSMHFSYKLQPGICNDFNASELMKKSGIKVLSNLSDSKN